MSTWRRRATSPRSGQRGGTRLGIEAKRILKGRAGPPGTACLLLLAGAAAIAAGDYPPPPGPYPFGTAAPHDPAPADPRTPELLPPAPRTAGPRAETPSGAPAPPLFRPQATPPVGGQADATRAPAVFRPE